MLTTRSPVGFVDTSQELQALLRGTRPHDVERGGHDDVCSAAINVWTHYWTHPTTYMASETIDTLSGQWNPPGLYEIDTDESFSLEDLMQELDRLELNTLGRVKHGDVPHGEHADDHPGL